MTDDLRKDHPFLKYLSAALAAGGAVWGITQWLGSRADQGGVEKVKDEQVRIRIEQTVMNGKVERVEQSQQRLEKAVERVESKLDDRKRRR